MQVYVCLIVYTQHSNVSTTPIKYGYGVPAMFTSQCCPLNGKHCRKSCCRNGGLDALWQHVVLGSTTLLCPGHKELRPSDKIVLRIWHLLSMDFLDCFDKGDFQLVLILSALLKNRQQNFDVTTSGRFFFEFVAFSQYINLSFNTTSIKES